MKLIVFNKGRTGIYYPKQYEFDFNVCRDICAYKNTDRCTCECVKFNLYEPKMVEVEYIENDEVIKDGWYQKVNFNPNDKDEYELKPIKCEVVIEG